MEAAVSAAPQGSESVRGHATHSTLSKTQRGGVAGGSIKEEQQEQEKEEEEEEEEEEPAMESGKAEDEGGEDGSEGIQGRGRGRERRKGERDVSPVPWDEWTREVAAILSRSPGRKGSLGGGLLPPPLQMPAGLKGRKKSPSSPGRRNAKSPKSPGRRKAKSPKLPKSPKSPKAPKPPKSPKRKK